MPRRREVPKRKVLPDPKFGSTVLAKFMNIVMLNGKKAVAESIVYGALDIIEHRMVRNNSAQSQSGEGEEGGGTEGGTQSGAGAVEIFEQALNNIRPLVEVRSRRVGGATYQIPVEVRAARSMALSMRWLVQAARGRREKGMMARLAAEIMEAFKRTGTAMKKREDTHRMAEANKAFAHFRWNYRFI